MFLVPPLVAPFAPSFARCGALFIPLFFREALHAHARTHAKCAKGADNLVMILYYKTGDINYLAEA